MSNIVTKTIDKLKSGSKETALAQLADKLRKNQIKCTAEGNPITEEELVRDLTADWRYMGRIYQQMGITLDELIETGKQAIADTSRELLPEPTGVFKKILNQVEKIGRNQKCPCGSQKKYKHCCGRDG